MFKTNLDFANLCLYNEMEWNIILFHLLWHIGAFLCQHEASKIKNTIVRNSFSAVVNTDWNITHTIEKHIAALSVNSFLRWFYMKEHHWLCTTEIIPPFVQNDISYSAVVLYKVKRRPCYCTPCSVCKREKLDQFNISLNCVYEYPVLKRYC